MRYSLRDLAALTQTALGRQQLRNGIRFRAWPLYQRLARRHRRRLAPGTRFVAVVGSFGKTTTTRATLAALGRDPETNDARNAWSAIARVVLATRPEDRHAVVEVGIDGPGQMDVYARMLAPDVTIVTTIGSEHGRSLGSLDNTRNEKAAMVRRLSAAGTAILNADDPRVLWMRSQTDARVVTYGFSAGSDVRGSDPRLVWPHGLRLTVETGGRRRTIQSRLVGEKMGYPLLAALAAAHAEGRDLEDAAADLEQLRPTAGRLEIGALPNGAWLLRDEFKSSYETVHSALDALETISAQRKTIVLGEVSEPPGSQGPIYREIGTRVARIATRAIFVGRNFRRYATGARAAGMPRTAMVDAGASWEAAVEAVRRDLEPGEVILVKGRDTQRLDRVSLALAGQHSGCMIKTCAAKIRCAPCPMFASGWGKRRVVL